MYPKYHFFLGLLFSLLSWFLFPQINLVGFIIILLSSILIDVDHYLFFILVKKDFNLKKAHIWFDKKCQAYYKMPKPERKQVPKFPKN